MLENVKDWGEISEIYEEIRNSVADKDLFIASEAQTRFDIIDRIIREVLQFNFGDIVVEPHTKSAEKEGFIDYILKCGDYKILIEAKKIGASFPNPTKRKKLKIGGAILGEGEIKLAIDQAESYAKNIHADIVIVTNGNCWCYYSKIDRNITKDTYATILFPFEFVNDAEELFSTFSIDNIAAGSLHKISNNNPIHVINSLSNSLNDSDARIDRNKIADYISLALDNAISGEAILNDENRLKYCFVQTDARTKYDSSLDIYIADSKPTVVMPAKRIKKDRQEDELIKNINIIESKAHLPVTLLIGAVGAGKSTYLSHFEKIHAKTLLSQKKCFWVYIDFEKLGNSEPKKFIYNALKEETLKDHLHLKTDYKSLIEPAYKNEFDALARGPFALMANDKEKFESEKQNILKKEYDEVFPYVDKLYKYISAQTLCVVVLDNIDLFENDELEIKVLSEGIALSKKLSALIMISIRDTTFVKHKNDSIFNAHELKKFWIDPPPLREVLSRRLKFAGEILKDKKAEIYTQNGMKLQILDLSIFFDIAQSSLLTEPQARFIECIADGNIRKGITLVHNFLISGHIQVERQIQNYLNKQVFNRIPFHEVFKGCVQGLWKNFIEGKAEILNILNSGLDSVNLQFLRVYILKFLKLKAKDKNTLEVTVVEIIDYFSVIGASSIHILNTLNILLTNKLISTSSGEISISIDSMVHINLSGAYYCEFLINRIEYIEAVFYDTPIFIEDSWEQIHSITIRINNEHSSLTKLRLRKIRLNEFAIYIKLIEDRIDIINLAEEVSIQKEILQSSEAQIDAIIKKQEYYQSKGTGYNSTYPKGGFLSSNES